MKIIKRSLIISLIIATVAAAIQFYEFITHPELSFPTDIAVAITFVVVFVISFVVVAIITYFVQRFRR